MKVIITVEETVKYIDRIVVIQPENMTDKEFEAFINKAEKETYSLMGGNKDFASILENKGLEVKEFSNSFPDNPSSNDFEIVDVTNLKEGGNGPETGTATK